MNVIAQNVSSADVQRTPTADPFVIYRHMVFLYRDGEPMGVCNSVAEALKELPPYQIIGGKDPVFRTITEEWAPGLHDGQIKHENGHTYTVLDRLLAFRLPVLYPRSGSSHTPLSWVEGHSRPDVPSMLQSLGWGRHGKGKNAPACLRTEDRFAPYGCKERFTYHERILKERAGWRCVGVAGTWPTFEEAVTEAYRVLIIGTAPKPRVSSPA